MSIKAYLGNAVYYEYDNRLITLTVSDGRRVTNTVHLDALVVEKLLRRLVADCGLDAIMRVIGAKVAT